MTTTTLRDRVYAAIPGYTERQRISRSAFIRGREIAPSDYTEQIVKLRELISDALVNNTPLPIDFATEVEAAERRHRAAELFGDSYRYIAERARQELEALDPGTSKEAYDVLNEELDTLVDTALDHIARLDGATNATEVVSKGQAAIDAWNALRELTEHYDEIRTVQRELTGHTFDGKVDIYLSTALIKEGIEHGQYWTERRRETAQRCTDRDSEHFGWMSNTPPTQPPYESESSWWPDNTDRTEHLVRLVTTTTPWVPDPDTLNTAIAAAYRAIAPIDAEGTRGGRSADALAFHLEQYWRIVDGEPELTPDQEPTDWTGHNKIAKRLREKLRLAADLAAATR